MILVTVPPLLMLFIPNYANIYLGIDAWWIFAIIFAIDVIFAWVITRIAHLCPEQNVVGMCKYAFGNVVGTAFAVLFALLFTFKSFMYFRQTLEYVYMSTYNLEPTYYYVIPMVLLVIIAQLFDSRTIFRLSNIVFGLMIATYVVLMISALRNFDVKNLMPLLVDGVGPVFNALPHFFTWTGNVVVLLMYFNVTGIKDGLTKQVVWGSVLSYGIIVVLNVLFIGVFGNISGFFTTSVFELSIFFNGSTYFNNFDSIIKLAWIFSTFIRDSIFICASAEAISQIANVKSTKLIRILLPLVIAILSVFIMKNEEKFFSVAMGLSSVLCAVVQYGAVLILWITIAVKKRSANGRTNAALEGDRYG